MVMDIINVILWCFLVYVCAYDWEDISADERYAENQDSWHEKI